jgi:hypothetical protein
MLTDPIDEWYLIGSACNSFGLDGYLTTMPRKRRLEVEGGLLPGESRVGMTAGHLSFGRRPPQIPLAPRRSKGKDFILLLRLLPDDKSLERRGSWDHKTMSLDNGTAFLL